MIKESVQKTLDYIEINVKEDITAEELAGIAGYSVFHFYRRNRGSDTLVNTQDDSENKSILTWHSCTVYDLSKTGLLFEKLEEIMDRI